MLGLPWLIMLSRQCSICWILVFVWNRGSLRLSASIIDTFIAGTGAVWIDLVILSHMYRKSFLKFYGIIYNLTHVWKPSMVCKHIHALSNQESSISSIKCKIFLHLDCAALNIFTDSSWSQLCHLNLELTQLLPDFLLGNHLWKGLISPWIMPVTLTWAWGMKISLMWLF